MYTENDVNYPNNYSVKKRKVNSYSEPCNDLFNSVWNLFANTGKFYLNVSEASIEAMRAFNSELYRQCYDENINDDEYRESILERNARFYEQMAENSKRAHENFKRKREEDLNKSTQEPIDYNRLAKLVAEELKKSSL